MIKSDLKQSKKLGRKQMRNKSDLISKISAELGMLPERVAHIIQTAPLRYKQFEIPKKTGGKRLVAQPAREVKAIQRILMRHIPLPVHSVAMAYQPGTSIKKNAQRHVGNKYLLKMDFSDFFPSILFEDVAKHIESIFPQEFTEDAKELIARIYTWTPNRKPPLRLCIGAPSSPMVSNSIMFAFDESLNMLAKDNGVIYTRYADDLTLSTNAKNILAKFPQMIQIEVEKLNYPKIKINHKKTVFASTAGNRTVTGVTLNSEGALSVGRDRKRLVSSMYHRYVLGLLNAEEVEKLFGLLSFINSIEPGFSDKLKIKHQKKQ